MPSAGGPCARAWQRAIPINANIIISARLLKLESPIFQFQFAGFHHCDQVCDNPVARENRDRLQVVDPDDLTPDFRFRCEPMYSRLPMLAIFLALIPQPKARSCTPLVDSARHCLAAGQWLTKCNVIKQLIVPF
jgi:hypothetical protein